MSKDQAPKPVIDKEGLRYVKKPAGSQFSPNGVFSPSTMSCFFCGKHRPRAQLRTRKLAGKNQAVCNPNCKTLDASITC